MKALKVEYVIRKGRKVVARKSINPMQAKKMNTNKLVLELAKKALAEELQGKGKHRVEILRGTKDQLQKVGEWTCVPAKVKIA